MVVERKENNIFYAGESLVSVHANEFWLDAHKKKKNFFFFHFGTFRVFQFKSESNGWWESWTQPDFSGRVVNKNG